MPNTKVKIIFVYITRRTNLAKYFMLHEYSVNKQPQPRTAPREVVRFQIPLHNIHNVIRSQISEHSLIKQILMTTSFVYAVASNLSRNM